MGHVKIIGRVKLEDFGLQHADIRRQLQAWIAEVQDAQWKTSQDIKARFVKASFLVDNRVIFNLKGNSYRLDVKVNYKSQIVLIKRIGTHADYDKWAS